MAITVANEADLRMHFADSSETQIDLANDITLTDCPAKNVFRDSATALTLDGHGFTVRQTCTGIGERVFGDGGTGALTFRNVTITGGHLASPTEAGGAIASNGSVTVTNSTISDNVSASSGGAIAPGG